MWQKILSVSIIDLICSAIGAACSVIGSVVSAVGGALASLATAALKICGAVLGAVVNLVKGIGVALGFLKPEDDMDELGYKAMNSDLKPEDFESHKAYVEALRNQPLSKEDKKKLENATEEEKLAWRGMGAALGVQGIEEEMDMKTPMEFWRTAALQGLDKDGAMKVLESYKEGDNLKEYADYFDDKLDGAANVQAGEKVAEVYQTWNPDLTEKEIFQKIDDDKETYRAESAKVAQEGMTRSN